jgi:hypothetical protein
MDLNATDVYYFAYGSNMRSSVMEKRGIRPQKVLPAFVPGYYLTFDIFGVPYTEPSMASISKAVRSCSQSRDGNGGGNKEIVPYVHGLAYLISFEEYRRLIASEGGGIGYDEVMIDAISLGDGVDSTVGPVSIRVHTLVAKFPRRPNPSPSRRYLVSLTVPGMKTSLFRAEVC